MGRHRGVTDHMCDEGQGRALRWASHGAEECQLQAQAQADRPFHSVPRPSTKGGCRTGLSQTNPQPQRAPGLQETPDWATKWGQRLHFHGQGPSPAGPPSTLSLQLM